MLEMGLHIFDETWPTGTKAYSCSFRETTLKVFGSNETVTFPVQVCTRVGDVKAALSDALMVDAEKLVFVIKQGCSTRQQLDTDEIGRSVTVRGITSFTAQRHRWLHPYVVIGAGYHGLKTCIMYLKAGNSDFVCYDRNSRVGGYCWITAANKTSKLQTEFGSFHVWWGQELVQDKGCGYPVGWETYPRKEGVLKMFQHAAEQYGVLPHIQFRRDVRDVATVGSKETQDRYYELRIEALDERRKQSTQCCSVMYNYPGSMTRNRIVNYPGEEHFFGQIGYGMNDDIPFDHLKGSLSAIVGNGAFAVENIRTCCEYEVNKVFLITRRKNLSSPRVPCWFVHQGPLPTPGRMVLQMFEPMYKICGEGMGDPWDYQAVHASKDRQKVTIIQNSRFGIGDVTFLAVAYGKCEYIEDKIKRLSSCTLHLEGGRRLQGVTNLIKALGLLGDHNVDKMHQMKRMVGSFINGDWRRVIMIDDPGMNAANFTTFSTGIATTGFVRSFKFLYDFPREYHKLVGMGLLEQLPVNVANVELDKPAYVSDVKFKMHSAIIMESMCPRMSQLNAADSEYKYRMYHAAHPLDRFLQECKESWDAYQTMWQQQGCTHEYIPYPYTRQLVEDYFAEYSRSMGFPLSPDGPPASAPALRPARLAGVAEAPAWAADTAAVAQRMKDCHDEHLGWWRRQNDWIDLTTKEGKPYRTRPAAA